MRYLALIYGDEDASEGTAKADQKAVYGAYDAFARVAKDKIVDGAQTAPTRAATTVRVRNGETVVSDGPAEQLAEPLGGFSVFECASMDEAVELAKQIPGAATGRVEIRPAYVEEAST